MYKVSKYSFSKDGLCIDFQICELKGHIYVSSISINLNLEYKLIQKALEQRVLPLKPKYDWRDAQLLRTLPGHLEDLGSISSTHIVAYNNL